jgi:hypothetical protein
MPYLFFLITFLVAPFDHFGQEAKDKTFYVAPGGSDNDLGAKPLPLANLEAARDAARKAGPGNHCINVMHGEYYLERPLELDHRDNGLIIKSDTSGKAIIYGGPLVAGWRRDGENFWSVDLPGVKEGTRDVRSLVVNGRMPGRARIPASGAFEYLNKFEVPWFSSVGGGWARKPTQQELTIVRYHPKDIPATLDIKNAEVRVYHSWDESLLGIARNDTQRNELIFSTAPIYPPGAFGTKSYVIFNTREGMTKPGHWYLDRRGGKLVYWPLEGEDMTTAKVVIPAVEQIISIKGSPDRKAENITLQGLTLQAANIPFKQAGMNAVSFSGAVNLENATGCTINGFEICNVDGVGISAKQLSNSRIMDNHIHHIGGGGASIDGTGLSFEHNHIDHTGIYYPGAVGLSSKGSNNRICYNEVHDIPYSGMNVGKTDLLLEGNLIYRVMREIHDGAAIYTFGASRCILRNNVIRDINTVGAGTGAFGYYLDEGSHDCIVEKNVSINVERPILSHIARNSIFRDNVFISDQDMILPFPLSYQMAFEGNTLVAQGEISISSPHAITKWKGNKLYSKGRDKDNLPRAFIIDSIMPAVPGPEHKTTPLDVIYTAKEPVPDGDIATDEWAAEYKRLDQDLSRLLFTGGSAWVKLSWDNKYLYMATKIIMFDVKNISKGSKWRKDDGVEISIGGFEKGKPSTFVIRSYANCSKQSVTDAGATALSAKQLADRVRYASKIGEGVKGWNGEWAIPWDALGITPKPGLRVPFNICAFVNEYGKWRCWEGTLGESWQVDKAGTLLLK